MDGNKVANPAFFRQGAGVSGSGSAKEAIQAASLDYTVGKVALIAEKSWVDKKSGNIVDFAGQSYSRADEVPAIFKKSYVNDTYAIARTDNGLLLTPPGRTVTGAYTCVQNVDAFSMVDDIVANGEAEFTTAGFFGRGETVYLSAKLPSFIRDLGGDVIEDYIVCKLSHDGSGGIKVFMSPIRVVCENTLSMALRGATNVVTFKHSLNVNERMKQISKLLEVHSNFNERLTYDLEKLRKRQILSAEVHEFMDKFMLTDPERKAMQQGQKIESINKRKANTIQSMYNTLESGVGQEYHRGTALWLYNGVSTFLNNKSFKNSEHKFTNLYEGTEGKKLQHAFDLITELV